MASEETKEIIAKVKHVTNTFDKYGDLKDPAVHIYNAAEKEDREGELKRIDEQLAQPAWVNTHLSPERRGDLMARKKDLEKQLDKYAPRDDLSGETKDALEKLRIELEEKIKPSLLPHEVMWRNPPGAPDEHLKRERAAKSYILMWKNVMSMLNPHSTDQDLRSIERLRPSLGNPHGAATFMANARLPGNFAMTPLAKDHFDATFPDSPTADTAMKQIERRENEELAELKLKYAALEAQIKLDREKQSIRKKGSGRRHWTEEQKQAARDRLAKTRANQGKNKPVGEQPSA